MKKDKDPNTKACSKCGSMFYSLRAYDICSECTEAKLREESFWCESFLTVLNKGDFTLKDCCAAADKVLEHFQLRFRKDPE